MAVGGVLLVLMGRADDESPNNNTPATTRAQPEPEVEPETETSPDQSAEDAEGETAPVLPESTCPPELTNCVVASGRILYVEKVDPDGDGDAHFVTASTDSVTGPGITIFDVKPELRPNPLPGVGQLIGGAGPVYPGSAGQEQIEVVEFHVAE